MIPTIVDVLFFSLVGLSTIVMVILIFGAIIYFYLTYHPTSSQWKLEVTWSVLPLLLFISIFVWGAFLHMDIGTPPPHAAPHTSEVVLPKTGPPSPP